MRQFLFGIQSISEAKNIFLHSILFLLNNTSLYTFIYYRAENPIRRVDTTEKVLILHKTVQGKAYLYVLHYYILYVKTVFQCPRLTSDGDSYGLSPDTHSFSSWVFQQRTNPFSGMFLYVGVSQIFPSIQLPAHSFN